MYFRIIRNDVRQSKLITATTTVFITVAAVLITLAAVLGVNLSGAIDNLLEQTKSPHYMQMHGGEIDKERMQEFADNNSLVEQYQLSEFLNIEGGKIQVGDYTFADNVQDNGIAVQNKAFDFMLDLENQPIQVNKGEVYAPIAYVKEGLIKAGDELTIAGKQLTVKGAVRDGQMNANFASSKRFLVNEEDYAELFSEGSLEYIIQFRLNDLSKLNEFEAAYRDADLEMNGPSGTLGLFKVINAISDGIMIAILLLVSLLVVAMAFMSIRFTLLAKIEEDFKEIGVMKAIGLQVRDIKKIYLAKYALVAFIGGVVGYLLSIPLSQRLLADIKLVMGESGKEGFSQLIGIVGVLLLWFLILAYVYLLLNRFKKISAVKAIRTNGSEEKVSMRKPISLQAFKWLPTNVFMGVVDVVSRKKMYLTMLLVFMLASFIMIVPGLTYQSMSSESFTEYLGYGQMDMMASLYQDEETDAHAKQLAKKLTTDEEIEAYNEITTKPFKVKSQNGADSILTVELGDHNNFPVEYTEGKAPIQENEIALSQLNVEEYQIELGDTITIVKNGEEKELILCGVYSNIFNGGKTAKAAFTDTTTETMWKSYFIKLNDPSQADGKMAEYKAALPFAKIYNVSLYKEQIFGPTIQSIGGVALGSIAVALLITGLVTALFMKLLVVKDKKEIAELKAIGYTNKDISAQYLSRSLIILVAGLLLGTLLASTLGPVLASVMMSMMGMTAFKLSGSLLIYLGCPVLMFLMTALTTKLINKKAGIINIAENLKE
ncbi:ABC transporter permease [uncultured Enterococcus sp.]|uniref:ABC transporter permease n=1 Tax=uncultured Enterococcus sp. TaxID=167972 RepID=UPI002AA93062|nr:ABC transporter permease [uncultured Enterococcus sp.]